MALIATKISTAAADNFRLIKGKYVTSAGGGASLDGDYIVCEVPKKAFVSNLLVDIAVAYTGSSDGTLTVGYKEPGASIVADGLAGDSVTLSEAVGVKRISAGRYFENGGIITLGVINGTSAAGIKARAWVEYTVIH